MTFRIFENNPNDFISEVKTPSGQQARLALIKFSLEPDDLSGCFVFLPASVKSAQPVLEIEDLPWPQIVKAMMTTLISINGFTDKLAHEFYNELRQDGNSYLQYLQENSNILTSILQELSELADVTSKVPHTQVIDLNLFVKQVVQQVISLYPGTEIDCVFSDLPKINSSSKVLNVILKNIFITTIQFCETGKITIELKADIKDGWCHITVSDKGSGIPDNLQHQLLSFTYETIPNAEESCVDYGNGLAQAVFLSRRLGGALALKSAEGEGTTVEFSLPVNTGKRESS